MLAYVEVEAVAIAAGISVRNMRKAVSKALAGKPWRGCALEVSRCRGAGGRAGMVHRVALASLPEDVRVLIAAPAQRELPLIVVSGADKSWKRHLVQSIVEAGPAGSRARADAIRSTCASATWPTGKRKGQSISERVMRGWLASYGKGGRLALERARRSDKGKERTPLWRTLQRMLDASKVPPERQAALAQAIILEVKTCLKSGAGTVSNVNMLAAPKLRDILLAELPGLTRAELDQICRMPSGFVRRFYRIRRAHQKRTDAKGFSDNVTCRVRRHRTGMVIMQGVAMDVRHSDIVYERQDGTLATAKWIVALDLATNRIFVRIFFMEKGEMIRREHVLMFMMDMLSDHSWGIPEWIYLDNGGEFKIGEAADELTAIAQHVRAAHGITMGISGIAEAEQAGVIRAKPYNGQSKVIEGVFSNISRSIEIMYQGFVGGNRQAKKVENQGREKKPMAGDEAAIRATFAKMVDYYNAKPQQRGIIKGMSPNDAFTKGATNGFQAVVFDPNEFALAFGKTEYRQVQTGGEFSFKGETFRHDDLAIMAGERIRIRVPILEAGGRIPVLDDKGNVLCIAALARSYGMRDLAGAIEGGRRNGVLHKQIRQEADGVPTVDLRERIKRAVAELPAPPVPAPLATVSISPLMREAAAAQLHQEAVAPPALSKLARMGQFAASQNEKLRRAG